MAINSNTIRNKNQTKYFISTKGSNDSNVSSLNLNVSATKCSVITENKYRKPKKTNPPYVTGDKGEFSRVMGKRFIHKQGTDLISSFPSAACIYKANSDEFKLTKRANKTVKKSVLTLPNKLIVTPAEACTVSDMNDSEYFFKHNELKTKTRKRLPSQNNRRLHVRNKDMLEFYDRAHLDCSSSDLINDYNGDCKRYSKKSHLARSGQEKSLNFRDVWAVPRRINQFQFVPSPQISVENIASPKKKRPLNKKRKHRKDTCIESCGTKQFSVTSKSRSNFSRSSSFDRITVINKGDEFTEICHEFENRISKSQKFINHAGNMKSGNRIKTTNSINKKPIKSNSKVKENQAGEEPSQLVPLNQIENDAIYVHSSKEMNNNRDEAMRRYANSGPSLNGTVKTYNFGNLNLSIKAGDQIKKNCNKVNPYGDCNETLFSSYSGSGEAALQNFVNMNSKKKVAEEVKLLKVSTCDINRKVKEITQDVFSNLQDVIPLKHDFDCRKQRLVTTAPSRKMTPKLTQTEIRRRLANMKFPIVILGKDQLSSSTIRVESFDAIQFNGLNKQVWPFMIDWYDDKTFSNGKSNPKIKFENENERESPEPNTVYNDYITLTKQAITKDTNLNHNCKKKIIPKEVMPCIESNNKQYQQVKLKLKRQFNDKVLQLLYKKTSVGNVIHDDESDERYVKGKSDAKKQKHTEMKKKLEIVNVSKKDQDQDTFEGRINLNSPSVQSREIPTMERYPWGKKKWASDFIENVIKKIKSGLYYNEKNISLFKKPFRPSRETSIQTNLPIKLKSFDNDIIEENKLIPRVILNDNKGPLEMIPGFKDVLQTVEIKTMNVKQIAVKHCLTNIMVQFDVAIQEDPKFVIINSHKASSFVPVTITDSYTKIFKCKTIILNPVLPAELCCLLPKMMHSIIESNANQLLALPPKLPEKNETPMTTIAEISPRNLICNADNLLLPLTARLTRSRNLIQMLQGTFTDSIKNIWTFKQRVINMTNCLPKIVNIFTKVDTEPFMPLCCIYPSLAANFSQQKRCFLTEQKSQSCSSIQLYEPSKRSLIPTEIAVSFMNILQKIWRNHVIIHLDNQIFPQYTNTIELTVKPNKTENYAIQKISFTVSNLEIDSLSNDFMKPNSIMVPTFSRNNEVNFSKPRRKIKKPNKTDKTYFQDFNTNKKKCFVRLYKKCKSATSISGQRTSTSLSKIISIDDFYEALGSGKLLANIFEGYLEKKILASIVEMTNWITEISQRQAMLVLLLTNKKDTLNLVRFRPILLQGIAVNRITRASELDMEIEVIERENVNKRSQCEGISYITSTEQTKDNLLEELCWIAKTTASDYQKPFDESTKRLLQSLLEKRRKLNPSYLRVMARYVGLGLLKPPSKIN